MEKLTIFDLLNGKKSVKLGVLKIKDSNDKIIITLVPDTSSVGTYGVKLSNGTNTQGIRMMYKASMEIDDLIIHFENYMNTDEPGKTYTVELEQKQSKLPKEEKELDPLKEELKRLKKIKYKTYPLEQKIKQLEQLIKLNPAKWQIGQGVGWKVTTNQINRGYQIAKIDYQNKEAIIKPVADTGLTIDGSDKMPMEWHRVSMVDLIRDKKYDLAS